MADDKKADSITVEVTKGKARDQEGKAHKVGDKVTFRGNKVPGYLIGKCKVYANGKG